MESNSEALATRWEAKQTVEIKGVAAEKAWSAVADFCNIHKWIPSVSTCEYVLGVHGQPGLVRHCTTTSDNWSRGGSTENATRWANERILTIDPEAMCLSYDIQENNLGFRHYVATFRVVPQGDDGGERAKGCTIEWSYVVDPIDGWKAEDLESLVGFYLRSMAEKLKACFLDGGEV